MNETQLAKLAAKVSNDVAEDIDCRETRAELRECIKWWSLKSCHESMRASVAEGRLLHTQLALAMLKAHSLGEIVEPKAVKRIMEVTDSCLENIENG